MTITTNELDGSYLPGAHMPPSPTTDDIEITLPSSAVTSDDGENAPDLTKDSDVTISNPVTNMDIRPELVFVYTNSITPVSTTPESTLVYFDVIFSVSITDESKDATSTHQVVKRIGVDKMKMANDAKLSTPVSIIEAKAQTKTPMGLTTARIKALAGIK